MCKKLFDKWKLNKYFNAQIGSFCNVINSLNYDDVGNVLNSYLDVYEKSNNLKKKNVNVEQFRNKYSSLQNLYKDISNLKQLPLLVNDNINELLENINYIFAPQVTSMTKAIDEVVKAYKSYTIKTNEMNDFLTKSKEYKNIIKLHNLDIDVKKANDSIALLFTKYISKNDLAAFKTSIEKVLKEVKSLKQDEKNAECYKQDFDTFEYREKTYLTEKFRKEHNDKFVGEELVNAKNKEIFQVDGGYELDSQQKDAVLRDEDYVIITAGAGSGKTATLTGKVNYLIKRKGIDPKEILLISFTRKATEEIRERVKKLTGYEVDAKTFHALGKKIYEDSVPEKLKLKEEEEEIIDRYFLGLSKNKLTEQMKNIIVYMNDYKTLVNPTDYDDYEEYYNKLQFMDLRSLKSKINSKTSMACERMRSLQEVKIADYLFLNGIEYKYEMPYEHNGEYDSIDENGKIRKNYRPDFYLVESGIYLEHFGINKDGKAPWLDVEDEDEYIAGMRWKRKLHTKFGTKLIETYSWWDDDGLFTEKLDELLTANGIVKKPIDLTEVYNLYINPSNKEYQFFKNLVCSFIKLYKTNTEISFDILKKKIKGQYDKEYHVIQDVLKSMFANDERVNSIINDSKKDEESKTSLLMAYIKGKKEFLFRKNNALAAILEDIYNYYELYLQENQQIDFNDMINKTIECLEKDKYVLENKYKYILIDEYQDIAINRFKLYKLISEKCKSKITVVGDDWQSIYRFTGSDINLFKDFDKYFNDALLLKIEKTYRNSQELLDISSDFVLKNDAQIKKYLVSDKHIENPIKTIGYSEERVADSMMKAIEEIVAEFGTDKKILILGRNNFDFRKIICDINMAEVEEVLYYIKSIDVQKAQMAKEYVDILFNENSDIINLENESINVARKEILSILKETRKEASAQNGDISKLIEKLMVHLRVYSKEFARRRIKQNNTNKDEEDSSVYIICKKYPNLEMQFLTVHKAKGMEADNVILLNNENSRIGFPNQIEDEPILQYLLSDQDGYPYAEERRLFYVALTRTKNRTYLLYPLEKPSIFIKELNASYGINSPSINDEQLSDHIMCLSCNNGWLVKRTSNEGKTFIGCTNWPNCNYTINTDSLENLMLCNDCGYGYIIKKTGRNGDFFECSSYPDCHNQIEKSIYSRLISGNGFMDNFKRYISKNYKCDSCNKQMHLTRLYNGKFVIKCDSCGKKKSVTKETYGEVYNCVKSWCSKM